MRPRGEANSAKDSRCRTECLDALLAAVCGELQGSSTAVERAVLSCTSLVRRQAAVRGDGQHTAHRPGRGGSPARGFPSRVLLDDGMVAILTAKDGVSPPSCVEGTMAVVPRISEAETRARLAKVEAELKRGDLTPEQLATLRELKMLLESKLRMLAMLKAS